MYKSSLKQSGCIPSRLIFAIVAIALGHSALGPITLKAQSLNDRLASLEPGRPGQYKLLAEELAAKTGDAEAHETALRLFHIAAWLEPENFAAGSLRSMIAIARFPEEEKRFRAAAYLLDPAAEPAALRTVAAAGTDTGTPPPAELLRAVRLLRQGGRDAARQTIATRNVQEYLAAESHRTLRDELEALLAATTLNDRQLRRVLELELEWLRTASNAAAGVTRIVSAEPWSQLGRQALSEHPTSVTLLNLTEFDPRANLYRNGRWVRE